MSSSTWLAVQTEIAQQAWGKERLPESGNGEEDSVEGSFEEGGRARAKYEIQRSRKEEGEGREVGFAS